MPVVSRTLSSSLRDAAASYPVVTLTGPRQSGKTTLCRAVFSGHEYVSLESLDVRSFAREDPRSFLAQLEDGAVLDEIQHAPDLPSYLQEIVDERPESGRFVLTGSQNLALHGAVSQSLAGRSAMLRLLPLSFDELREFPSPPSEMWDAVARGGYPRIYDRGIPHARWLDDYVTTYLERDVRQVLGVGDLLAFGVFLRLAAGRTAQTLNLSALGADAGVSHNTARSWLSVLEATFVCQRVGAWSRNVRKQIVKAPKLHFLDTGLAAVLLGIQTADQLRLHPLRGPIFESWVVSEIAKHRLHRGMRARLQHYRESRGAEVDLVVDAPERLLLVEIKSGRTIASDWIGPLARLADAIRADEPHRPVEARLVYGGDTAVERQGVRIIPWNRLHELTW